MNVEEKIKDLENKIDSNFKNIINNMNNLHKCEEKINKNTGALELLHTINNVKKRFFIMWFITFIALIISISFNAFLLLK